MEEPKARPSGKATGGFLSVSTQPQVAMAEELTLATCTKLNAKLLSATDGGDTGTLRDVLQLLQGSKGTKDLLQILAQSKLSKTVHKLSKHEDATIASPAAALVSAWRALLAERDSKRRASVARPGATATAPLLLAFIAHFRASFKRTSGMSSHAMLASAL